MLSHHFVRAHADEKMDRRKKQLGLAQGQGMTEMKKIKHSCTEHRAHFQHLQVVVWAAHGPSPSA
jgi:hypothetical protein